MKRQTYRKDKICIGNRVCEITKAEQGAYVVVYEIEIFEKTQNAQVCNNAHDKKQPSPLTLALFDEQAGEIINHDRKNEHQNVNGNKCHVEITTGHQQQEPAVFVGQYEK